MEKIPQIVFVFLAFLASLGAAIYTRDVQIISVTIGLGGALSGVAVGRQRQQQISADADTINVETDSSK